MIIKQQKLNVNGYSDGSEWYDHRFVFKREIENFQQDLIDFPGDPALIESLQNFQRMVDNINKYRQEIISSFDQKMIEKINKIYIQIEKTKKIPRIGHGLLSKLKVVMDAYYEGIPIPGINSTEVVEIPGADGKTDFQIFPSDQIPDSIFINNPKASASDLLTIIEHIIYRIDDEKRKKKNREQNFSKPSPGHSVFEYDKCLFKMTYPKSGNSTKKKLTSFTVKPISSVTYADKGEFIEAELVSNRNTTKKILLPPDAWFSTQKFLRHLPSSEYTFFGGNQDVQLIRHHLSRFPIPRKKGVKRAGLYDGTFVTEYGSYGFWHQIPGAVNEYHRHKYIGEKKTYCQIIKAEVAGRDVDYRPLIGFNSPKVVLPVLGFAVACFFKPIIMAKFKGFPILVIEGEAGAGKTTTVDQVLMRLWSIKNGAQAIGEQSKFTIMKHVDSSNCIPVFFEENKGSMQNDLQKSLVSDLIRSSYNAHEGQRGRADQTMESYRYMAPLVIAGETGFSEPAVLDRIVPVHMSKKESSPYKNQFDELKNLPIEGLGKEIMHRAVCFFHSSDDSRLLKTFNDHCGITLKQELEAVDSKLKDRPQNNAAICRFGLRMLEEIINANRRLKFHVNFTGQLDLIDEIIYEGITDDGRERKSAVDKILEAMSLMSSYRTDCDKYGVPYNNFDYSDHLESGVHYKTTKPHLRLWVAGAYPIFYKWAKQHGFESDVLPEGTFKNQLKKEPYFVKSGSARIGYKSKRCFTLDLEKMKTKGLDVCEEWLN